ncbi:winged helix-turn-helix domain-containing protein [Paenibacillus cisolokensis]|uniref:winged helix-turn-helix domain-containing protein n=1 Tax=Paenibacillus cisolokensis TaxID=1658519 RepID=UPI003D28B1A3
MDFLLSKPIFLDHGCYIDLEQSIFMKNGLPCSLSRLELRLLQRLAHNLNEIVPSESLYKYMWLNDVHLDLHLLYVYINRVRNKIEDHPRAPKYIISIRGVGYKLMSSHPCN